MWLACLVLLTFLSKPRMHLTQPVQARVAQLEADAESTAEELEAERKALSDARVQIAKHESEKNESVEAIRRAELKLKSTQSSLIQSNEKIAALKSSEGSLLSQLEVERMERQEVEEALATSSQKVSDLSDELESLKIEKFRLEGELRANKKRLGMGQLQMLKVIKTRKSANKWLGKARSKITAKKAEMAGPRPHEIVSFALESCLR